MKFPFLFSIFKFARNFQFSAFFGIRSDTQLYNSGPSSLPGWITENCLERHMYVCAKRKG